MAQLTLNGSHNSNPPAYRSTNVRIHHFESGIHFYYICRWARLQSWDNQHVRHILLTVVCTCRRHNQIEFSYHMASVRALCELNSDDVDV